jgi:hypothetical protein
MKITHLSQSSWMNYFPDVLSDLLIGWHCKRLTDAIFLNGAGMTNATGFSRSFFFAHPANLPELSAYVHS